MFLSLVSLASCARYAFLYAGSNEFINYRHQADIFTIYNQLLNRGFTKENIALYAYDDIATDPENPFQGQVFHSLDHKTNVYPGSSAINVKGNYVTADAFNNAIKYLPTTSEDYVFIYYDNHGGAGFLGTPYGNQIYWDDITRSFKKALSDNLYKKCLFIIEACYSGSIGKKVQVDNLAMITSANDQQSSYATVYDTSVGTYLTNEFTDYFIHIIDEKPSMTVGEFFNEIKSKMEMSSSCYYGDESIQEIQLEEFIGTPTKIFTSNVRNNIKSKPVTQREATETTLKQLASHPKASIRAKSRLQMLHRKAQTEKLDAVLEMIVEIVDPNNFDKIMNDTESDASLSYLEIVRVFMKRFGDVNPDDFSKFNVLKALAASHTKNEIIQAIFEVI